MPSNTFATSGRDLVGHTIDNGRLELLSVLGLGAYGVVYLAVDLHAPKPVYLAVKCLLRAGLDSRQRHFQRREIALHQLASRHPNVVTLHKVLEEGEYIFVIMDFCDDGDLFGMITERQRYIGDDYLIKKVFLQIVDALEYCHSMGIFHRDLKPENILCTRDGERICIADFGLATSERTSTDFGCGSTFYLSPECQGGLFERIEKYNTQTNDIWALGVILVNLTCGRNPWRQACPSDETFRAFVHNPEFLRTILPISHATNHILKGLFALDPAERVTLRELRRQILAVETFTMTDEELSRAHSAARAAAAAVRPIVPAAAPKAKAIPAPAPAPASAAKAPAPVPAAAAAPVSIVTPPPAAPITAQIPVFGSQPPIAVNVIDHNGQYIHVPFENDRWSSASAYPTDLAEAQIDESVFNHIDFTRPSQAHITTPVPNQNQVQVQVQVPVAAPAPLHINTHFANQYHHNAHAHAHAHAHGNGNSNGQYRTQHPTPVETPSLISSGHHHGQDDYDMLPSSARSSSSGDDGISLPPTPEFNPATGGVAVPRWDLVQNGGKVAQNQVQVKDKAMLHVNSPTSPYGSNYQLI